LPITWPTRKANCDLDRNMSNKRHPKRKARPIQPKAREQVVSLSPANKATQGSVSIPNWRASMPMRQAKPTANQAQNPINTPARKA
jgi:hypothetical protein